MLSDIEHLFQVRIGHLYVFFDSICSGSLPIIYLFAIELYDLYILICILYIFLDIKSLSDKCFANIFPYSVGCFFILLTKMCIPIKICYSHSSTENKNMHNYK